MIRKKSTGKSPGTSAAGAGARRAVAPGDEELTDPALARVRELARIATEFDLAEVELEPAGRIRVSRRTAGGPSAAAPALGAGSPPPLAAVTAPEPEAGGVFVSSPFVGTFYRSPAPDAASFVEVGQSVRKGQVVCIIEAMKLMNEIESEADGKVADVLVKNGEHVEYGQKLFRLAPA